MVVDFLMSIQTVIILHTDGCKKYGLALISGLY